jgi:hypothetical protein
MTRSHLALAVAITLVSTSMAQAQATTVQLPTFNVFTTTTTVSVPDRGGVLLGGVNRGAQGSNEFGTPLSPLKNRGIGQERSAATMSVHVTIHDMHLMDEEILARANYVMRPNYAGIAAGQLAAAQAGSAGLPTGSLADLKAQREIEKFAVEREAAAAFEKGLKAEDAGKPAVAKIHYQMALKRATSAELKTEIEKRLAGLSASPSRDPRIARSSE